MFHLGQPRRLLDGKNRIARAGSGAAVGRADRRFQLHVDEEVAAAAFRRVVRLDGEHVFALDEVAARRRQVELDVVVLLDRRAGAGAEARLLGGDVAAGDVPAVDPHVEAVVELQRQRQRADHLRVPDRELFAEVNRRVAVAHVAQHRLHEVLPVADRCATGQPTAFVEVRHAPGGARTRRLTCALEVTPSAAPGNERVGLGRDVAADGRLPVVAVVVVELGVDQLD